MKSNPILLIFFLLLIIGCKNEKDQEISANASTSDGAPSADVLESNSAAAAAAAAAPEETAPVDSLGNFFLEVALARAKIGKCNERYLRLSESPNTQYESSSGYKIHEFKDVSVSYNQLKISDVDRLNEIKGKYEISLEFKYFRGIDYNDSEGLNYYEWVEYSDPRLNFFPGVHRPLYYTKATQISNDSYQLTDSEHSYSEFTNPNSKDFCRLVLDLTDPKIMANKENNPWLTRLDELDYLSEINSLAQFFKDSRHSQSCYQNHNEVCLKDLEEIRNKFASKCTVDQMKKSEETIKFCIDGREQLEKFKRDTWKNYP